MNLTPIKGDFIMYANNNGILPSKLDNQKSSTDNKLELEMSCDGKKVQEYLIGV